MPDLLLQPAVIALINSRSAVDQLLKLDHVIDLVIPRGTAGAWQPHMTCNYRAHDHFVSVILQGPMSW